MVQRGVHIKDVYLSLLILLIKGDANLSP